MCTGLVLWHCVHTYENVLKNFYLDIAADVFVGYEFSLYTTTEDIGQVEICAVLMDPGPTTAPQDFVLSSTTESGTASMLSKLSACYSNVCIWL